MTERPEALVERVAQAIQATRGPKENWERVTEATRNLWRADARAALDASGLALLEAPSEALIDRAWQVATATGTDLSRTQLHDICQALADEILSGDGKGEPT